MNHINKNFESIYNKKFSNAGASIRPISSLNNKNLNAEGNDISNYNTAKDSLFGLNQGNNKKHHNNNAKNNNNNKTNINLTNRNNSANKGNFGRSNSLENNSTLNFLI